MPSIGNYSGGVVNVVTKSGSNELHGSGFEFLRNTDLDARNFFSPERSFYRQNQFGGTVGGPIKEEQAVLFWRLPGNAAKPGRRYRADSRPDAGRPDGQSGDQADSLTGEVSGPYLANLLTPEARIRRFRE